MRVLFLALLLAVAPALSGCGSGPRIHVEVIAVSGFSIAQNVTVELWAPSNAQVLNATVLLQPGGNVSLGFMDGPAGAYTGRAKAGVHAHVQEDLPLRKGTTRLFVLANQESVDFSLDSRTPL